eukprot:scaffold3735_cov82-Cyclotella_meneghiniana.AAC.4
MANPHKLPSQDCTMFEQEMMGWHDPKITVTITCCELCNPHNIVNTGPPTAGASSAACKYHLDSSCKRRFAPEGRSWPLHPFPPQIPFIFAVFCMNGNLRGNGCSGHDRPPEANHPPIGGDEAPAVACLLSTMLWEMAQQVIGKRNFHFYTGSC